MHFKSGPPGPSDPKTSLKGNCFELWECFLSNIASFSLVDITRSTDRCNGIEYRKDILGRGGFSVVFKGRLEHRNVAVKRVMLEEVKPTNRGATV